MNILIAGGTGQTGTQIVEDLLDRGHQPFALVRDGSDTSKLPAGAKTRTGDLTDLEHGVCDGMDAVIFAAGSGSGTGQEMTDKVDRDGAMRLVDIAANSGAQRFVMLSSIGADQSNPEGELAHYLKAKHDADQHLIESGMTYAILRPVALTNDDYTGDVILGDDVDKSAEAHRADVAHLLSVAATSGQMDGKVLDMQTAA